MAERLRQLLDALDVSTQLLMDGQLSGDLKTIARQLMDVLKNTLATRSVTRDEKLMCVALALSSEDPPDLVRFIKLGVGDKSLKNLHAARTHVLKELYGIVKEHHGAAYFRGHEDRLFREVWDLVRVESVLADLETAAIRLGGLLAKRYPHLLLETDEFHKYDEAWPGALKHPPKPRRTQLTDSAQDQVKQEEQPERTFITWGERITGILHEERKKKSDKLKGQAYATSAAVIYFRIEAAQDADESIETATNDANNLLVECDKALKAVLPGLPNLDYLAGLFSAVDWLLRKVTDSYGEESGQKRLYGYLQETLREFTEGNLPRYAAVGKAMRLLEHHAPLLRKPIVDHALQIHDIVMNAFVLSTKKDHKGLKKHAMPCLESVLNELSRSCVGQPLDAEPVRSFVTRYSTQLDQAPQTRAEALMVIRGVSAFLEPLISSGVRDVLPRLMALSDRVLMRLGMDLPTDAAEGSSGGYTGYTRLFVLRWRCLVIEAAAKVMKITGDSPEQALDWLADMSAELLGLYYTIDKERERTRRALVTLLRELGATTEAGQRFLGRLVPATITRAITREDVLDEEGGTVQATVYANLWKEVSLGVGEQDASDKEAVLVAVLEGCVEMLGRLDIGYTFRRPTPAPEAATAETSGPAADPEEVMTPHNAMDHELFLSLVAFMEGLMSGPFEPAVQVKWSPVLAPLLVQESLQWPHVSGFYRLVELLLRALEATNALRVQTTAEAEARIAQGREKDEDAMDVDRDSKPSPGTDHRDSKKPKESFTPLLSVADAAGLSRLLGHYIDRVLSQLDQYQDELLACALSLVLNSPSHLLLSSTSGLSSLLPALRLALTTGTSHPPTAHAAVSAIERWVSHAEIRREFVETHLPSILPLFDMHLYDTQRRDVAQESRVEKDAFQKRLLRVLGRLGGRNQALVEDTTAALQESLAWESRTQVELKVPMDNTVAGPLTVDMDLAMLLPRLLRLAESKGEAQVKTLASEAIHAVVIFMVAQSATDAQSFDRDSALAKGYGRLYRRVFPTLLRLALDLDPVTRQLFQKLVPQLIHWFSRSRTGHPETVALLDSLSDGLSSADSGPVRSFCAGMVGEFLRYNIRQGSKKQLKDSPITIDALVTRLERLARHPNKYKRLGGAMAMNQCLHALAPETEQVRRFILRLLNTAIISLGQSHIDPPGFATADLLSKLVDRIVKVIRHYLQGGDRARLKDDEASRGPPTSLPKAVDMLWQHVGAPQRAMRQKSQSAFSNLVALLPSVKAEKGIDEEKKKGGVPLHLHPARPWVLAKSLPDVLKVVEGPVAEMLAPGFPNPNDAIVVRDALDKLTAAVEAYLWLFQEGILLATSFFKGEEPFPPPVHRGGKRARQSLADEAEGGGGGSSSTPPQDKSTILKCIREVMKSVWSTDNEGIEEGDTSYETRMSLAPSEARALRSKSAVALSRVFDLVALLAEQGLADRVVKEGLWSDEMQRLLSWCLVRPWCTGVLNRPEEDDAVNLALPASARKLLKHWEALDGAVAKGARRFPSSLAEVLSSDASLDPYHLHNDLATADATAKATLIQAVNAMHTAGGALLRHVLEEMGKMADDPVADLALHLMDAATALPTVQLDPRGRRLSGSVFLLSISLGAPVCGSDDNDDDDGDTACHNHKGKSLLSRLRDTTPIRPGSSVTRGQELHRRFTAEISDALQAPVGMPCLKKMVSFSASQSPERAAEARQLRNVFMSVVDELLARPVLREPAIAAVLKMVVDANGGALIPKVTAQDPPETQLSAVATLMRLLRLDAVLPVGERVGLGRDPSVRHVVCTLLKEPSVVVAVKSAVLGLLPLVLPSGYEAVKPEQKEEGFNKKQATDDKEAENEILDAVEELKASFPASSRDWQRPSGDADTHTIRKDTDYELLLKGLLVAVAESGHRGLMMTVVHHFIEGRQHRFYNLLRSAFEVMVARLSEDGGKGECTLQMASFCLDMGMNGRLTNPYKAMLLHDDLLLPLLQAMPQPTLKTLLSRPASGASSTATASQSSSPDPLLKDMLRTIEGDLRGSSGNGGPKDADVFPRIAAFTTLRVMFERFDRTRIKAELAPLAIQGEGDPGPQLNKRVIKACKDGFTKPPQGPPEGGLQDWVRLRYCAAAFQCIAAMLVQTQSKTKVIVDQSFGASKDFWKNIVDMRKRFRFTVLREKATNRLLPDTRARSRYDPTGFTLLVGATQFWSTYGGGSQSQALMKHRMLSQSSLSQRVSGATQARGMSQLDASSGIMSLGIPTSQSQSASQSMDMVDDTADAGGDDGHGTVQDAAGEIIGKYDGLRHLGGLNKQPCMGAVLALLEKLEAIRRERADQEALTRARDRSPAELARLAQQAYEEIAAQEDWHEIFVNALRGRHGVKGNARLFVMQVVLNEPASSILAPHVSDLGPALVEAANDLLLVKDPEYGHQFHYMLTDVCDLLVTARGAYKPTRHDDKAAAAKLLVYLVKVAHGSNQPITRRNLFYISELLQRWVADDKECRDMVEEKLHEKPGEDADEEPEDNPKSVFNQLLDLLSSEEGKRGGSHQRAESEGTKAVRRRVTAINVFALLLNGGINFLSSRYEHDSELLVKRLKESLDSQSKPVWSLCAELWGMLVAKMYEGTEYHDGEPPPHKEAYCKSAWKLAKQLQKAVEMEVKESSRDQKRRDKGALLVVGIYKHWKGLFSGDEGRKVYISVTHVLSNERQMDAMAAGGLLRVLAEAPTLPSYELHTLDNSAILNRLTDTTRAYVGKKWRPHIQINAVKALRHVLKDFQSDDELCQWLHHRKLLSRSRIGGSSRKLPASFSTSARKVDAQAYSLVFLATSASTDVEVREEIFELLMELYERLCPPSNTPANTITQAPTSSASTHAADARSVRAQVVDAVRFCLIKGLADPDDRGLEEEDGGDGGDADKNERKEDGEDGRAKPQVVKGIRRKVMDFWDSPTRLGLDPLERLDAVLHQLYDPESAPSLLPSACYLLLSLILRSPWANRKLSDRALSDCQFNDMNLQALAGLAQARPMTPLFSILRTQASQVMGSQEFGFGTQSVDVSQIGQGLIRATQQPTFMYTQTQALGQQPQSDDASNLRETRFLIDLGSVSRATQGAGAAGRAAAARALMPPPPPRKRKAADDAGGGGGGDDKDEIAPGIGRPRKQRKVVVYRRYRDGELPDIEIQYKDVIRPLQGLSLRDGAVARQVFTLLFKPLFGSLRQAKLAPMRTSILQGLIDAIKGSMSETEVMAGLHTAYRTALQASPPPRTPTSSSRPAPSSRTSASSSSSSSAAAAGGGEAAEAGEPALDCHTSAESGLRSLNYHSGVLVLEEQILKVNPPTPAATRTIAFTKQRRRSTGAGSSGGGGGGGADDDKVPQDAWLELARLYRALEENDVLIALTERATKDEGTRRAVELELEGDSQEAANAYEALINDVDNQQDDARKDLWEKRRRECLRRLGKWMSLRLEIQAASHGWEGMWSDESRRDSDVPMYAEAVVNASAQEFGSGKSTELNGRLKEELLCVSGKQEPNDRRQWLEKNVPYAVAAANMLLGDYTLALAGVDRSYRAFLEGWAALHPCAEAARKARLEGLELVVEMEDYLVAERERRRRYHGRTGGGLALCRDLLQKWEAHKPSILHDPPLVWSAVGAQRTWALVQAEMNAGTTGEDAMQVEVARRQHSVAFYLDATLSAIERKDNGAASNLYEMTTANYNRLRDLEGQDPVGLFAPLLQVYVAVQRQITLKDPTPRTFYKRVPKRLEEAVKASPDSPLGQLPPEHKAMMHRLRAEWLDLGYTVLLPRWAESDDVMKQAAKFHSEKYGVSVDPRNLRKALLRSAMDGYFRAAEVGDRAEATFRLARLCDGAMAERTAQTDLSAASPYMRIEDSGDLSTPTLAGNATRQYLSALQHGPTSLSSRQTALTRVVDLLHSHDTAREAFSAVVNDVPPWVFLPVMSQLLACVDSVEGAVILPLLERMAQDYPQALYFPFRVTREGLSEKTLSKCAKLSRTLSNPLLDRFCRSLALLAHPGVTYATLRRRLEEILSSKESKAEQQARREYVRWRDAQELPRSWDGGEVWATYDQWLKRMDALYGRNGEKLTATKLKEAKNKEPEVPAVTSTHEEPLKKYSEWLASYQLVMGNTERMEVPGQYEGLSSHPPRPELHTHIASLDGQVLCLASKQQPKKIVLHGDDEKEYPWLIKAGEDTRNDQRIEQLFVAVNAVMEADPSCRQARLHCRTYKIVPVSTSLGMIEWVPDTRTVKSIITDRIGNQLYEGLANIYHNEAYKNNITKYHQSYKDNPDHPPRGVEEIYRQNLPWDIIRAFLMRMAPEPEAFLTVRNQFAKSLAAFNVCSYVAGVGDRHLENFLYHDRSGSLVGIDFGYAFGVATSGLGVPELIPFRLTPQFTSVLEPLDSVRLLAASMSRCLAALRDAKEVLLSTIQLYLKEPVVDWAGAGQHKLQQNYGDTDLMTLSAEDLRNGGEWEPLRKIVLAKGKLEGMNPVHILLQDLQQNKYVAKLKSFEGMKKVIIKAAKNDSNKPLTVAEQVDVLVNLATDPNLLLRQWVGLATYL